MFEKEAKKWVKEHTEIEYKASYEEFSKEPSAIKSFKAGAEFGYNKANEWHDLQKDPNDLPKHTKQVIGYCRGDYYDVCFFNGKKLVGHGESDFLKWKEIE